MIGYRPFNAFSAFSQGLNTVEGLEAARQARKFRQLRMQALQTQNALAPRMSNARLALINQQVQSSKIRDQYVPELMHLRMQALQNQNLSAPQMTEARLALINQRVQGAKTRNKYVPQMMNLRMQALQNQNVEAPQMSNARLALLNAEAKSAKTKSQYAPELMNLRVQALQSQNEFEPKMSTAKLALINQEVESAKTRDQYVPQMMNLKLQALQNQNLVEPKMSAAKLALMNAEAKSAATSSQYAPELMNLKLHALQNQNLVEPQMSAARLALINAEAQSARTRTKYVPQLMNIQLQNAKTRAAALGQSQRRFGKAYALQKYLNTPMGEALLSKNPALATNVADYIGKTSAQISNNALPHNPSGIVNESSSVNDNTLIPVISPQQIRAAQTATSQSLLKRTTDPVARQKTLYAANIDKTLDSINLDALTHYAGIGGALKKATEAALAPQSQESPEYDAYQKNVNLSKLLAKQVRQFYGDSIQPSTIRSLQSMTNPATWSNNPKLAKQKFNAFANILRKETATYRSALQSPNIYYGTNQTAPIEGSGATSSAQYARVISPSGQKGLIPISNLKAALKAGWRKG